MPTHTVAVFGEAEKGQYHKAYYCRSLPELVDCFGHPPTHSIGLYFAIQALLYQHNLYFLRVREEGFSLQDYFRGFRSLEHEELLPNIQAIGIPGVGNAEIIHTLTPICTLNNAIMILTEPDLYDYLTEAC